MKQSLQYLRESLKGLYEQSEIDSFFYLIISHLLGYSRSQSILNMEHVLPVETVESIKEITQRLEKHEPIQYILGETEFYGLTFHVETGILIPRFETEELVDLIVKKYKANNHLKILDIGTGSGCIAISLKKHLPNSDVWCCDISDKALEVTMQNARSNNLEINAFKFDILSKYLLPVSGFNIIISNPPYVTEKEKEFMQPIVLDHEPSLALFVPDDDPLLFYRVIVDRSKDLLLPEGDLFFEINELFGDDICKLMHNENFTAEIISDINGKDRIVHGHKIK